MIPPHLLNQVPRQAHAVALLIAQPVAFPFELLLLVEQGQIEGYISASTFSDLYYIIRKSRGREWTTDFLNWLVTYCKIATVNEAAIRMALTANFRDLEDAIQYATAVINQLDVIITRNSQDFPVLRPRIITPEQLIQELTNSS